MLSNIGNGKRRGGGDGAGRAWRGAWPYAALALAVVVLGLTARLAWALNYAGYVTVIATMGQLNPNPIRAGDTATASLSATYEPPANLPAEATPSAQYSWSVSVAYKALYADSYGAPPPNSYTLSISPSQPSPSGGAELSFTPLIAGYWQLTGSCGVKVTDQTANEYWTGSANTGPADLISYTFDITYTGSVAAASGDTTDSGTVVTGKTTDVHAGWPIQLGAELAPSDLASKFTWTISGAGGNGSAAINGYSLGSGDASAVVDALVPSADTEPIFPDPGVPYAPMLFNYYYTESGNYSASVSPQGVNIPAATASFSVVKPSGTLSTATSAVCGGVDSALGTGAIDFGDAFLTKADPGSPYPQPAQDGIEFEENNVQCSGFGGSFNWVQVYTGAQEFYNAVGTLLGTVDGGGLDTTFPYGDDPQLGDPPFRTDDSPSTCPAVAQNGVCTKVVASGDPEMWFIYLPSAPGSIWVPVNSVSWSWGGTDTQNAKTMAWGISNTSSSNDPAGTATNTYPVWGSYASRVYKPA